mmetsp:Transcript_24276/g.36414  ORF Transcript_24276/g.36414 Transcript_24276/m.36414 type:complete len:729 (+) Transcript_24276:123-2309(+)
MSKEEKQEVEEESVFDDVLNLAFESSFIIEGFILALIYVLAISIRLFPVANFESVLYKFDSYYYYRATQYLLENGFSDYRNWFDSSSWYPYGNHGGGLSQPGLVLATAGAHYLISGLCVGIDLRYVCIYMGPFLAANSCIALYILVREVDSSESALLAAALLAVIPAFASRSMAGTFDNEPLAIFCLLVCMYSWIQAAKSGRGLPAMLSAFSSILLLVSWNGTAFIYNLIPLHVLWVIARTEPSELSKIQRRRIYAAYSTFYVWTILLHMQIPGRNLFELVQLQYLLPLLVFIWLQCPTIAEYIATFSNEHLTKDIVLQTMMCTMLTLLVLFKSFEILPGFNERLFGVLNPVFTRENLPLVASVAENQPTAWASFFNEVNALVLLYLPGIRILLYTSKDNISRIFVALYAIFSLYFSGVMVRLLFLATPAFCICGGITVSSILRNSLRHSMHNDLANDDLCNHRKKKPAFSRRHFRRGNVPTKAEWAETASAFVAFGAIVLLALFLVHSVWTIEKTYSSPVSVVLTGRSPNGRLIFDDFREAYSWLRVNTPSDAKVLAWWDYGYHILSMANRTVYIDNNTLNETHIATVSKIFASSEHEAYPLLKSLDVDFIFVIFGGVIGYASDDLNKLPWMLRLGNERFPQIKEQDYRSIDGSIRVDEYGTSKLSSSLLYRLCYYRFGELMTASEKPLGYDRVRKTEIGLKAFELQYFHEALTTKNWMVRIYKVNK